MLNSLPRVARECRRISLKSRQCVMGLPIVRIGALEDAVLLDRLFSKSRHFAGFGQIQVSVQGIGIQLQLSCVLDHRLLELSLVDKDISKIVVVPNGISCSGLQGKNTNQQGTYKPGLSSLLTPWRR